MQSDKKKPELLAPAGDLEKLRYALAYGADAVYIGGTAFGLRAYAGNFTTAEMKEAVSWTHALGKKLYVTVNIFAHEEDFGELPAYLATLAELGVDALIVSDPGVLALAQEVAPGLSLHLSTQANNTNSHSVRFWLKHGVERVVLARELTLTELGQVRGNVQGELEMFVHGAMCMSYSGRCLLSNYLTGRDANRGECAQPCRWGYSLVEEKRPGQAFPLEEDERGTYIFNSHDLCLLPHLPLLLPLEIDSFKIEGRMKSIHYVASSVKVYREALDTLWQEGEEAFQGRLPEWLEELDKVSHRDYSAGFLFGKPGAREGGQTLPRWCLPGARSYPGENMESSHYVREYDFVGVSLEEKDRGQTLPFCAIPGARSDPGDASYPDFVGVSGCVPASAPAPEKAPAEGDGEHAGGKRQADGKQQVERNSQELSGWVWVEQRNNFKTGDLLEVLTPEGPAQSFTVTDMFDSKGEPIQVAPHAQQRVLLKVPRPLPPFSILRRAKQA